MSEKLSERMNPVKILKIFTEIEKVRLIAPYINEELIHLLNENEDVNVLGLLANLFENNSTVRIYSTLTKYSYIDVKQLIMASRLSERTVRKTLKKLVRLGVVHHWKLKNKMFYGLTLIKNEVSDE